MNTMKRFLCLLLSSIITILSLSSCGKLKDFTEEDQKNAIQRLLMGYGPEVVFDDAITISDLIFVGSVKKTEEIVISYESNGQQKEQHEKRYTIQVDDLWGGETVGGFITLESSAIGGDDSLFLDHPGCSYVFMLLPWPEGKPAKSENPYFSAFGLKTIIPIQPSTGNLYFLVPYLKGIEAFDGHPPEKLKEYIQDLQQQVLEKGYKEAQPDAAFDTLGLIFQPYQTAYETGKPVEFIPYVIQKLIEGPLSAYEGEPYYDALLTRVKKVYNSRKNRWGMTEGKLYSILEEMLPKLADKARKESK